MKVSFVRFLSLSGSLGLLGFLLWGASQLNWIKGSSQVSDNLLETAMLPQEERLQILQGLPMVTVDKPRVVKRWSTPEQIFWPNFSPNGRFLLLGGEFGGRSEGVRLYETRSWKEVRKIPSSRGYATFSPDSQIIATDEKGVSLYRTKDAAFIRSFGDGSGRLEPYGVWGPVTFSQDGNQIATYGEDPRFVDPDPDGPNTESANIRLIVAKAWDLKTGKRLSMVHNLWSNGNYAFSFQKGVNSAESDLHVFGSYQVAGNTNPCLAVQSDSWTGNSEVVSLQGGIENMKHSSGRGGFVASPGLYKPTGTVQEIPQIEKCRVYIAADASIIIGSSTTGAKFWMWRVRDGKLLRTWTLPGMRADAVAISGDGRTCAVVQPFEDALSATNWGLQGRSIVTIFDLGLKRNH